jgi:hypothetical protein
MSDPSEDLLVTAEGVDEGSADSTAEGPGSGARDVVSGDAAAPGQQPAPPVDMDSDRARAAREQAPGQQLEAGEG